MIEITHSQAQRLIRESLDRPVAEPQWNALEAHLETCPACRAYRDRRHALMRGLARLLHDRWWTVMLDGRSFPAQMTSLYTRHARRARKLRYTLLALILLVAAAGALLNGIVNRPQPAAPQPAAAQEQPAAEDLNATPTLPGVGQPGSFGWQVVYEAAGPADPQNREIYLLSPGPSGPERTNLSRHPAADTGPVWSPDGQWIAFLSDRDSPEGASAFEIYVVSIAGTRLTRLTADPNLRWQGPLSWSPDGRTLAAVGVSDVVPQGAVYLLPVDGEGRTRPVPNSLGGASPSFAPRLPRLAFTVPGRAGRHDLFIHDLERAFTEPVYPSSGELLNEGAGRGLNWSADGKVLAYLAFGPVDLANEAGPGATWLARTTYNAGDYGVLSPYLVMSSQVFAATPGREMIAAAFSPEGDLFYMIADAYGQGCAGLQYFPGNDSLAGTAPAPPSLPALCLDTPIERASWSQDGEWLVAAGRERPGAPAGVYAMRVPGVLARPRLVEVVRLADLPDGAGAPRVRPDHPLSVPVDPQQAAPAIPGQELPPNLLDRVLVSRSFDDMHGWLRSSLSLKDLLRQDDAEGRLGFCPRRSPDGQSIAYVASSSNFGAGAEAIIVEDLQTGQVRQVSSFDGLPASAFWGEARVMGGFHRCPEWSPDSEKLATYVSTDKGTYLAVFSTQPEADVQFVLLDHHDMSIPPRWDARSTRVAVVHSADGEDPARIVTIDPGTGKAVEIIASDGWNRLEDMAYSPDGLWLAYLPQRFGENGLKQTELRVTSAAGWDVFMSVPLPAHHADIFYSGYTGLTWLPGGQPAGSDRLGLTFRGHKIGGHQSALMVYDLAALELRTLVVPDEDLRTAAWSPDGNWVVYSVPSGMWALNLPAALAGAATPTWLGIKAVDDINWR